MKKSLYTCLATAALGAGVAQADEHLAFVPGEGDFSWGSYDDYAANAPDLNGQTVTVFGPWLSPESENFAAMAAYFEQATGAQVTYTGSDGFEQQIVIDAEAGSPPNIAVFPQPGLAASLASQGLLAPLGDGFSDWVDTHYAAGSSWVDLGTYANPEGVDDFYGLFFNVNVKSLVWYVPENFEDAGYDVPQSMEELIALSEQIIADGETPWCIGLGSGAATGWVGTDWIEDIMLRTQTPDVYDMWVTNALKFNDPKVIAAFDMFGLFAKNDDMVAGGAGAVGTTDFRDSPAGMFSSPAQCYMHRQASFVPAFFPEGTELGTDADFFYMPSFAGKDLGNPVLGGGTVMAVTDATDAAMAFMAFLQTPIAHELMMAQGGFLTPYTDVNLATYMDDTLRGQGEILQNATTFRFDASDLMPSAIGAGAFWTAIVDFVGGTSAHDATNAVQDSWSALK